MARLFPSKLSGSIQPEVLRTFRKLKQLSDDFTISFSIESAKNLAGASNSMPHFLIIWQEKYGFLLHVASTTQQLADTAVHGDFFNKDEQITIASLAKSERELLSGFTQNLPNPENFPLQSIIVFPNINRGTLDTIAIEQRSEIKFLSKQQLSGKHLESYFIAQAPSHLTEPQILQLRHHFSPEISLPPSFSPIALQPSNTNAQLTPQLLDLDQEWCMKNNLYLPEEASSLALPPAPSELTDEDITSQLVTGVAGSGKTLVLLYRALLNAQLNPGAKVLVLTHNRPLIHELQARFNQLSDKQYDVTWMNFFSWARSRLNQSEETGWPSDAKILYSEDILRELHAILAEHPDISHTAEFLRDEIGFIKDHQLLHSQDYLNIARSGQGKSLKQAQRQQVWKVFKLYQQRLKDSNSLDWHSIAMRFHKHAMNDDSYPKYHCILIDEAQFFAKSWFDIIKKALLSGGQLFLSADPTQGFLKRRQSWISSGIEVRGRTTKLEKAYRNSREILEFATHFYKQRQHSSEFQNDGVNLLSPAQIQNSKLSGFSPTLIPYKNHHDSTQLLINELRELSEQQSSQQTAQPILILHTQSQHLTGLLKSLKTALPNLGFHQAGKTHTPANTFAQLCSVKAATGLEAPVVFLLGADMIIEKEGSLLLSNDAQQELILDNTRQLYMAFTRAAQRLIIFTNRKLV